MLTNIQECLLMFQQKIKITKTNIIRTKCISHTYYDHTFSLGLKQHIIALLLTGNNTLTSIKKLFN